MSRANPTRLVEGVDYYMEEGRFVFTAAYHKKRGYCCNSRCRHCPYVPGREASVSIQIIGLDLKRPLSGG